ncbi:glycosyl transferase family 2 [Barrientosiimonas humi]|uniref:Glycosyl transferase family 2 n=1 Tax=Barrientosiimonas humi TaxID=999931 RepID=A0A542XE40_9MICO|nr:glycosyltransferase family 2 protein [Barrientosiimonas humi]TQL34098.1 glycosyl transferase family 2 [Barrientosiimonas humi]CAG7574088.1 Poly-beta-1,6-N-acetyl-D-glucosamine synthase [Barrientosiimonas humi]
MRSWLRAGLVVPEIVAIVPAHNEQDCVAQTITSLLTQTVPPTTIVLVADNCTDRTVEIAREFPVVVMETVDNPHRKSGALNQAWALHGRDADVVFTMDADTVLQPDSIEQLVASMLSDRSSAAVCARYWARDAQGLAQRLQRLEYARYDDNRELRGWRIQVASGAAAMYRGEVLRRLPRVRAGRGPWDEFSLIEDYGLTLDLKSQGYRVRASSGAHVITDTPKTFGELWTQRLRWGRGGVDECRKRGWVWGTRRDIAAYGLFGFGLLLRLLFIVYVALVLALGMSMTLSLIGMVPLAIMWFDRVTSAWRVPGRDWRDMAIVLPMLIEDFYGLFLEVCTAVAVVRSLRGSDQNW